MSIPGVCYSFDQSPQSCHKRSEERFTPITPKGKELESNSISSDIIFNII
jgi:hypothetical protein